MGCEHLAPQTIKTYLSAIRYMQIVLGLPEPKQFSSLPRLHLVQMGIKRNHSQHRPLSTKVRLPITPAILRRIKALWSTKATDHNKIMLWVAACLCFFGFFRAGEITIPTAKAFDPKIHLSWGDIAVDDITKPSVLQVSLKRSKCDQFGQGVKVYIGRTGDMLCPVAAVLSFMASRGSGEGPFFRFSNGQPLTKGKFTDHIRQALRGLGLPYQDFAGHSFRIGAATAAANAGIEDSIIRTLGRWNSSAFLIYIRTPRERLAQLTQTIANS